MKVLMVLVVVLAPYRNEISIVTDIDTVNEQVDRLF
jgi:hypothetical protein